MANASNEELEGITLDVYLHVLRSGKPVGPREVMKAVNLSSPSVAYRHLQKLEDLGYLQKNQYGEYVTKNKAHVAGYVWVGNRLMPKMWRYSLIFCVILAVEAVILAIHYPVEHYEFKVFFLLLILLTLLPIGVFTVEGARLNRRTHFNRRGKPGEGNGSPRVEENTSGMLRLCRFLHFFSFKQMLPLRSKFYIELVSIL